MIMHDSYSPSRHEDNAIGQIAMVRGSVMDIAFLEGLPPIIEKPVDTHPSFIYI